MRVIYANDTAKGPGYGFFRVADAGQQTHDVRYALIRSGDHKTLHPQSWEDTEYRFTPDSAALDGETLCLGIGPDVVRQLDELNTYRFVLFVPDGVSRKAPLELSGVIYPPEGDQGRIGLAPDPKPQPQPAVKPEPAPIEADPLPPLPPVTPPAGRGFPIWLAGLIAIVLLAGAGGAYWLLANREETPPPVAVAPEPVAPEPVVPEPVMTEPAKPEATPPQAKPEPQPAVAEQAPPAQPLPPMERARALLRTGGSPEAALALSKELPHTPEGRDAAYLLLEAAAEQGQPDAMLGLASFYDPRDSAPKGSIVPDAEQAWQWYAKAVAAGKAEAAETQKELRAWLEAEAQKGSAEAKNILTRLR